MRRLLSTVLTALPLVAHAASLTLGVVPQPAPPAPYFVVAGPTYVANPLETTVAGGGAGDGNYTETTSRLHSQMGNCSPTSLRFLFVNGGYAIGNVVGSADWQTAGFGNSAAFEAAVEYPIGTTTTPLTFGGNGTISVASGAFAMSDPMTSPTIPAHAHFMVRTRIQVTSGGNWFVAWTPIWTNGSEGAGTGSEDVTEDSAGVDQTNATGALVAQSGGTTPVSGSSARMGIGPIAILGNASSCKSVMVLGASTLSGAFDSATCSGSPLYLCGDVMRGLTDGSGNFIPFIRATKGNLRSGDFCTGLCLEAALLPYVRNLIGETWSDDFDGFRGLPFTAAQSEAYATEIAQTATGLSLRYFPGTLDPGATSTDEFETYANQTQSWNQTGAAITFNDWILAGNPPGSYAYFDPELGNPSGSITGSADPANRYIFYVNGTAYFATGPTSAGIHPNGQGYAQGAADVSQNRVPQLQ